ncbi:MAG: helix-turn-helix domain-containing protein [Bacillota bacterium]
MSDYDRKAVGERIRLQRKALGLSQEEFAERIERVPKFCADIERGQAGMSIATLLKISALLKVSLDYLLLGKADNTSSDDTNLIVSALNHCTKQQHKDAYELLKLFLKAIK